jgi:hypothetical protein
LSGITEGDLEHGLDDTRHGQTLNGIFKQKIQDGGEKTTLFITVPESAGVDEESVLSDLKGIFDSACAEVGVQSDISDLYDVSVETVNSEADAERVSACSTCRTFRMCMCSEANACFVGKMCCMIFLKHTI